MAGLVRPKAFPIRKITSNEQRNGRIFNPRRLPDHGGLDAVSKWGSSGEFHVEPPTKVRSGEKAGRSE